MGVSQRVAIRFLLAALGVATASPLGLSAQTSPIDTVTVTGLVVDAATRMPLVGAQLSIGDRGPRAASDAEGHFALLRVPRGPQKLLVKRFGYADLTVDLIVSDSMGGIPVQLQPDPVALAELAVTGEGKRDARGKVVDRLSNQPVGYANLTLTRDGVRTVGRVASSETNGGFKLDDVQFGGYLLKVERVGYVPQYLAFGHPEAGELEVRLEPNPTLLEGLTVVTATIEERAKHNPYSTWRCPEKEIRESRARLLSDLSCISHIRDGSRPLGAPETYLDEVRLTREMAGMISAYSPTDFYRIEAYLCPNRGTERGADAAPLRGTGLGGTPLPPPPLRAVRHVEYHYFTYEYMERLAAKPRVLNPPCTD
jgi:hypothetical protein